ncbi:MAG: acyl-CoA thioesterase [Oscillospiraceae bacterium]|nr:acyl-CoA thioesterase [Oscillospiraceae bacterium]
MTKPYLHTVHYHETDKMGIAHHANYVKWMEQARIDFLAQLGFSYAQLEQEGVASAVTEISASYLKSAAFADTLRIAVSAEAYNGVLLRLRYSGENAASGETVFTAESAHCFLNAAGKPARLPRLHPALHQALCRLAETAAE